ncbi:hypothetical protein CHLNCDRAFT_136058 [Chlorella variabilis]|uniref:HTH myb-type domain-containing protein n=1 Tax=Chlorella variabilis TaxID=554065 RepID=E1ZJN4_CHLVA|nr:hypothetical protein CHLNCDRAFT_136058 [Chlorella variabilis]EFN54020.1 hypothetical protein CHLNCDRAFT_136058 [Chlorella variabilis]|eukprot:XP_005846122.1 hypothetical protein CHLNCDRAFT_136058 [Chlorella variabilis]
MRWTKAAQMRFQQAVEQSGGIMAATPRAILDALTMEGVTYAQVKSHLQRYRTAHIAELLERGEEVGDASEAQLSVAARRGRPELPPPAAAAAAEAARSRAAAPAGRRALKLQRALRCRKAHLPVAL